MQTATTSNDIGISSIKRNNYRIYFWYMNKVETINGMNNTELKKVNFCKIAKKKHGIVIIKKVVKRKTKKYIKIAEKYC